MATLFELRHVVYKQILHIDVLDVEEGKVTVIVGESGSGKSTLLRLLNHLISCDEGTILYKGIPLGQWDPIALRREVVMLPQQPVIFPGTIEENVQMGRLFAGQTKAPIEEIKVLLAMMKITYPLDKQAEELSGGEKQRLAWARVMAMDGVGCYVLDEPTSALDEENALEIMGAFIKWAKNNEKTIVMVTHSKQIAQTFADYTFVVEKRKGDNAYE